MAFAILKEKIRGLNVGCTLLIKEGLKAMTETDTKLAYYLLDHSSDVIHMNAKELAAACGSSPAAVVRFSRKLGFKGFPDLKLDLAKEQGSGNIDEFQTVIRDNDDMATIVEKAERIHLRNVSLTYKMVNITTLSQAVDAICSARRIQLFGVGASGLMALDFFIKPPGLAFPSFTIPTSTLIFTRRPCLVRRMLQSRSATAEPQGKPFLQLKRRENVAAKSSLSLRPT